ncbi:MAG: OmpA family protein [Lunatimonas sp.]|uniref:OmpA family protein n=1 Tax=Lunatimonas sp. TaxID=2060141 RepID=UPI00263B6315|nr:OmpA family protein [Lunatimonas sp.]MCC5937825.1 OmpA family protein [Lunatimonas sp.]
MKQIFACLFILAGLSLFSAPLIAQNAALRYADTRLKEGKIKEAALGYEDAFSRKPSYRAAIGAAEAYLLLRDYPKTHLYRKNALKFTDATREDAVQYIASVNLLGDTDAVFKALDSLANSVEVSIENLHLDSLRNWYGNALNAEFVPVKEINTPSTEYGIVRDAQGNTYFSSDRGDVGTLPTKKQVRFDRSSVYYKRDVDFTGRNFLGIYRLSSSGTELKKLDIPVPNHIHASDPTFLPEQSLIFYSVTRRVKSRGDYTVYPEIYYSKLDEEGKLTDYVSLPFNNALEYGLITPYVDAAAKRLYFASDMPGGQGGYDLYYVTYDENLKFSDPINLGPSINTPGHERDPYVDGSQFYFSSNGHPGLGGQDLFVSDLRNGIFQGVRNLGIPINSPQDDLKIFKGENASIYVASNRNQGLDDVYRLQELFKKLQAVVLGCDGEPVQGELNVVIADTRSKVNQSVEVAGDGTFTAQLGPDADFEVSIRKPGYFALQGEALSSKGVQGEGMRKSYRLIRIPYQAPVYTDLIYYNLDQSVIRKDAEPILTKVAELLKSYSFIDISVDSHTDARASDEYNQALSERRANAVRDFLSQYGIARSRVKANWYGKTQLVNDCGDGVPCPEQDHQLNRRSELVLYAFPELDKAYDIPLELAGVDLCEPANLQIPMEMPVIYFDFDRADLSAADKQSLERVVLMLRHMVGRRLQITGHTDSRGSDAYNQSLSEKRAVVVKSYLEKRGVASERMVYDFFGKLRPVNNCETVECNEAMNRINRRTELSLPELNKDWTKGQR